MNVREPGRQTERCKGAAAFAPHEGDTVNTARPRACGRSSGTSVAPLATAAVDLGAGLRGTGYQPHWESQDGVTALWSTRWSTSALPGVKELLRIGRHARMP